MIKDMQVLGICLTIAICFCAGVLGLTYLHCL